jgi:hypothetical protein
MNRILLIVAAVVVAMSWTTTANAKQHSDEWGPGFTTGYTETQTDLQGNVLATRSQTDLPGGAAINGDGGAPALPLACCSSSGCDTVDYYDTKRDAFGIKVVWQFHQVKHWCWSYPRITALSVGSYFSNVDWSSAVVNWDDHGYGYYYTWSGSNIGGHYSYRQGSVSNCVFRIGCLGTAYPQVEIWVNGNGAWLGKGGGT